jgi:hypothetical protein
MSSTATDGFFFLFSERKMARNKQVRLHPITTDDGNPAAAPPAADPQPE